MAGTSPPSHMLALTFRMLRDRGFVQLPRIGATRRFEGLLECRGGAVRVRLTISDWDFVHYPTIRVLDAPPQLPVLTPHIDADRGLCYLANGAVVLDRYHPEHAIAQCLDRARLELDRLMTKPTYRQDEFASEFGASWNVGQRPLPWTVLLASIEPTAITASALVVGPANRCMLAIASDADEIHRLCEARGWPVPTAAAASCWLIRSDHYPTLPAHGLPQTIGDMFAWIKAWDHRAYSAIQTILAQPEYLQLPHVIFLVQSPAGWFGFELVLDPVKRKAFQRRPRYMRQSLHGRDRDRPISRLAVQEIGAPFVHGRNLTYPSLRDRHITLVGCGAIGGYLAQALVKLGAGTGAGQLMLIDPDELRAENLGRHWLGFGSLFMPKAEAVQRSLQHQFPGAKLVAYPRPILLPEDLKGDLVINATGEEALSEAINYRHVQLPSSTRPPLLHVWVAGNGDCVQALWTDTAKYACYRCLRCTDPARTPRFPLYDNPPEQRNLGCHAFTPYAVSAPMAAAALATDMVVHWLQGDPSPRFRTRLIEGSSARKHKPQNIEPLTGCPACSPR